MRCILNIKIDIVSITYTITNNFLFNSLYVRRILNIKMDIISSTPSLTISYLILYLVRCTPTTHIKRKINTQVTFFGRFEFATDPLTHVIEGLEVFDQSVVVLLVEPREAAEPVPAVSAGRPVVLHAKRRHRAVEISFLSPRPAATIIQH